MDLNDLSRALTEAGRTGATRMAVSLVDPTGLRRFWEFMQEMQSRYPPLPDGGCVGIDIRMLLTEFPDLQFPGRDPLALWFRAAFVGYLHKVGALQEWDHGTHLDDVVFQVAAIFPIGAGEVDAELFRAQLRNASGANT